MIPAPFFSSLFTPHVAPLFAPHLTHLESPMAPRELTAQELLDRVGDRHPVTGIEYPPEGMQPYYAWLLRSLHLLAEASAGHLRVAPDEASDSTLDIAPGRCTIAGVALDHPPQTLDLAAINESTAFVWAHAADNAALADAGPASAGWPSTPHIPLAIVALDAGRIQSVTDLRAQSMLSSAAALNPDALITHLIHDPLPALGADLNLNNHALRPGTDNTMAFGAEAQASTNNSIALGNYASASDAGLAIGTTATCTGADALALGQSCVSTSALGIAIGISCTCSGEAGFAMGNFATNQATLGIALGSLAQNLAADGGIALGPNAINLGDGAFALGDSSIASAPGVCVIGPPIALPRTCPLNRFNSAEIVIATDVVDLTLVTEHAPLLPAGTHLHLTQVGLIITSLYNLTTQPTVRFGVPGSPALHVPATLATSLANVFSRQSFTPASITQGIPAVTAGITVPAVATQLLGRFYWKGILIEDP